MAVLIPDRHDLPSFPFLGACTPYVGAERQPLQRECRRPTSKGGTPIVISTAPRPPGVQASPILCISCIEIQCYRRPSNNFLSRVPRQWVSRNQKPSLGRKPISRVTVSAVAAQIDWFIGGSHHHRDGGSFSNCLNPFVHLALRARDISMHFVCPEKKKKKTSWPVDPTGTLRGSEA